MQIYLRTQLLYNFLLTREQTIVLISEGTSCLDLFYPFRTLASQLHQYLHLAQNVTQVIALIH